jgi:hypothetical protein
MFQGPISNVIHNLSISRRRRLVTIREEVVVREVKSVRRKTFGKDKNIGFEIRFNRAVTIF